MEEYGHMSYQDSGLLQLAIQAGILFSQLYNSGVLVPSINIFLWLALSAMRLVYLPRLSLPAMYIYIFRV